MQAYKGYMIPDSIEDIRKRVYTEHWDGDWLVLVPADGGGPDKYINLRYERGELHRKDVDVSAVISRCRAVVDRYAEEMS